MNDIIYVFGFNLLLIVYERFYGVMVSTMDFESIDPGSNPGRTYFFHSFLSEHYFIQDLSYKLFGTSCTTLLILGEFQIQKIVYRAKYIPCPKP